MDFKSAITSVSNCTINEASLFGKLACIKGSCHASIPNGTQMFSISKEYAPKTEARSFCSRGATLYGASVIGNNGTCIYYQSVANPPVTTFEMWYFVD